MSLSTHKRALAIALTAVLTGGYAQADAARIFLRHPGNIQGGSAEAATLTAELGEQLDLELVIDAGGEDVTGISVFVSFDSEVFRAVSSDQAGGPFASTGFLDGLVLLNRIEEIEGESFLSYIEASGVRRTVGNGEGVVARFALEVLRRPAGDLSVIAIEERGHDRRSHYFTADAPGTEKRFEQPMDAVTARIRGFRILSLPDLVVVEGEVIEEFTLVEGEPPRAFDLDDFVDQEGAQVLWSNTVLSELPTTIDPETNRVTMSPIPGKFGTGPNRSARRTMIFTALEVGEGLTAQDTIGIQVLARPQMEDLPSTVRFPEDEIDETLDLDAFVTDTDDLDSDLIWTSSGEVNITVEVDPNTRIVTFSATPDWFGQEEIRLQVTDADGLSAADTILVEVTPVNDAPSVRRMGPVYPSLGGGPVAVPLSELLADVDDDLNQLEVTLDAQSGVTARTADGQLLIEGDNPGRSVIGVTVTDAAGARDEGRIVAVVLAPGETVRPEIQPLPVLKFPVGQVGALDLRKLVMDDAPVASLTWNAAAGDELRPLIQNGVLLVSSDLTFTGESSVELTVTDADGNRDSASLVVVVLGPDDDTGPTIRSPGKVGVVAGRDDNGLPRETVVDLDDLVTDPNDDPGDMSWTVAVSQGLVAVLDEASRTVRLQAPDGLTGPGSLNLTVRDPTGFSDEATVPVLVVDSGGPPALNAFGETELDQISAETRIDLDDFAFDDEDFASELFWSAEAEPGVEVELDPVSHVLRIRRVETSVQPAPASSKVILKVADTSGQESTGILEVGLPPVFNLIPIPDIDFFSGDSDTTLVLDDHVAVADPPPVLEWQLGSEPKNLVVTLDAATNRVRISARDADFAGTEILLFTARDETGRSRNASVKVTVRGRGLTPQVREFPRLEIRAGETDNSIDLDDFVVDDDPDEVLTWTFLASVNLEVDLDPISRELAIFAQESVTGSAEIQFAVVDPAGNSAFAILDVLILRGGEAPVIATLPQILIAAGDDGEQRLSLDLFVDDPDTPDEEITWRVSAQPGVAARIEDRQLFLSVPATESGLKRITLTAADPQGNEVQAELTLVIQADDEAPEFTLEVRRNAVITDLLEVIVRLAEALDDPPLISFDGTEAQVLPAAGDRAFVAAYQVPTVQGDQVLRIRARVADAAGNEASRELVLSLRWMSAGGGSLTHVDGAAVLNVPDAAAGPGQLAALYRVDETEVPPNSEGQPVYAAELSAGTDFRHPVTLNLFAGAQATAGTGVLRWDPVREEWEELPTVVDEASGWLTATIDRAGLYRIGTVAAQNRRASVKLSSHPNPFSGVGAASTQIEYEVDVAGPVRLAIVNILGQTVRLLVDEESQREGLWSVVWDGRDQEGRMSASGVYYCELSQEAGRESLSLLLVR